MKINEKIIDYRFFKEHNSNQNYQIIDNDYFTLLDDESKLFKNLVDKTDEEANILLNFNNNENLFYSSLELNDLLLFRKTLIGVNKNMDEINFFTISSKDSFSEILLIEGENEKIWKHSVLYFPLNDHSRGYLRKGDVLFCNRIGQFENLSEALKTRGVYGLGIALTDPIEFFPDETGHNKYGVIVCFPLSLKESLSTRNIQMNPITIDLTPYNGNRNDSLQWIPEKDKAIELLKMLAFSNNNIYNLFSVFYNYNIPLINILPSDFLNKKYNTINYLQKFENKNTIYYGAPGTGKSYKVNEVLKILNPQFYERITFHPEFDHASFVGGYKPVSIDVEHTYDDGDKYMQHEVHYKFVPQAFTNIYQRAWNDLDNQYYLAIEEINRGNCAEIFGDIFQLLDRNSDYTVSPSNELKEHLNKVLTNKDGINNGLKLPPNLSILATMNTSDQSLFPMDSAFKRRWDWEYIPISYDNSEDESFGYNVNIDDKTSFKWNDFIKNVNAKIKTNPNLGMDKCIGNYFIKSETKEIQLKEFINKAVFYLWNDVFKDEDSSDSIFEKGTTYEDFFPIETKGIEEVIKILKAINIEPTVV
ncbi:McrB family protein [Flavobacterium sp. RSB2_4_14]|uniref:McrB family protein n=1 Tax=Flavobacterium sp. RSB2_4_14 TaxID=3447665 RepID=UPI003F343C74